MSKVSSQPKYEKVQRVPLFFLCLFLSLHTDIYWTRLILEICSLSFAGHRHHVREDVSSDRATSDRIPGDNKFRARKSSKDCSRITNDVEINFAEETLVAISQEQSIKEFSGFLESSIQTSPDGFSRKWRRETQCVLSVSEKSSKYEPENYGDQYRAGERKSPLVSWEKREKEEEEEEKAKGELSLLSIAGEKGNQLFRRRLERGSLLLLFAFRVSERTRYLPTAPIKGEFRRRTVFQQQRRE